VATNQGQNHLQASDCDVHIEPNNGQIIPGAIWAAFECDAFGDPSMGESGCTATGKFLFENCGK
jgi:hypothetical protein